MLIAAPTGSGKTLAAFLAGIDALIRKAEAGLLDDQIEILYVSPLKALGADIHRNLEAPLAEINAIAAELGYELPPIRVAVRSGDTTPSQRQTITKNPPHILITTPESLYLMLTAAKARPTLRHVRTLIVDEIHALVRDRRGSHMALSVARLDHVAEERPARIGLSATQRPIDEIARFLVGPERADARTTAPAASSSTAGTSATSNSASNCPTPRWRPSPRTSSGPRPTIAWPRSSPATARR